MLAAVLYFYALAKFSGSQFIRLNLTSSLNELDPVELVWNFLGYSQPYGLFIAAVQLVAGMLLLFRNPYRPDLPVYFGIVTDVAVLDWCFSFPLPAMLLATSISLTAGILLWLKRHCYTVLLTENKNVSLSSCSI